MRVRREGLRRLCCVRELGERTYDSEVERRLTFNGDCRFLSIPKALVSRSPIYKSTLTVR